MLITKDTEPIHTEECYKIVGACMAVHSELGQGFLEAVYQEALAIELGSRGIPFEREKEISVLYRGIVLSKLYKADFVCYGKIIVELKALSTISNDHITQLLNYLKASGLRTGLLINFGASRLEHYKYVL